MCTAVHSGHLRFTQGWGSTQLVQSTKVKRGRDIDDIPRGIFSDQYRGLGAVSTDRATVELPVDDALVFSVQFAMGRATVPIVQYILVHEGYLWMLTSSGPNSAKDAAEIAATFRFV